MAVLASQLAGQATLPCTLSLLYTLLCTLGGAQQAAAAAALVAPSEAGPGGRCG